ncbi:hypothetical protein ACJMCD_28495 (plasmid) [Priestia megaterium]|uniref:hypothetical protein n=1 Tax=Priestia megaterium TaxID=1404 RepID=UPI00389AD85E
MLLYAVTKVATNDEMVKQMQQQVISMQDKQISFLNDTIANTYTVVGIVVALVGIVATVILAWISKVNLKAQKKLNEAEKVLGNAQTFKEELVEYKKTLTNYQNETIDAFNQLADLVNSKDIEQLKHDVKFLSSRNEILTRLKRIDILILRCSNIEKRLRNSKVHVENSDEIKEFQNKHLDYISITWSPVLEINKLRDLLTKCIVLEEECTNMLNRLYDLSRKHLNIDYDELLIPL